MNHVCEVCRTDSGQGYGRHSPNDPCPGPGARYLSTAQNSHQLRQCVVLKDFQLPPSLEDVGMLREKVVMRYVGRGHGQGNITASKRRYRKQLVLELTELRRSHWWRWCGESRSRLKKGKGVGGPWQQHPLRKLSFLGLCMLCRHSMPNYYHLVKE